MHRLSEGLRQYEGSVATPPNDRVDTSTPTYSSSTMNDFGTDPHKLHRTDSPATSRDAAYSVDTTALEQLVYEAIRDYPNGCIADELLARFNHYPYSSITARFRALIDKGFIEVIGTRKGRSGRSQRVMRVRHH